MIEKDGDTGEQAVQQLREKSCIQPVLFTYQGRHWIKLDNTVVAVNASCIADASQLVIQYFLLSMCHIQLSFG